MINRSTQWYDIKRLLNVLQTLPHAWLDPTFLNHDPDTNPIDKADWLFLGFHAIILNHAEITEARAKTLKNYLQLVIDLWDLYQSSLLSYQLLPTDEEKIKYLEILVRSSGLGINISPNEFNQNPIVESSSSLPNVTSENLASPKSIDTKAPIRRSCSQGEFTPLQRQKPQPQDKFIFKLAGPQPKRNWPSPKDLEPNDRLKRRKF